jgi:hypothetical protein
MRSDFQIKNCTLLDIQTSRITPSWPIGLRGGRAVTTGDKPRTLLGWY